MLTNFTKFHTFSSLFNIIKQLTNATRAQWRRSKVSRESTVETRWGKRGILFGGLENCAAADAQEVSNYLFGFSLINDIAICWGNEINPKCAKVLRQKGVFYKLKCVPLPWLKKTPKGRFLSKVHLSTPKRHVFSVEDKVWWKLFKRYILAHYFIGAFNFHLLNHMSCKFNYFMGYFNPKNAQTGWQLKRFLAH